MAIDDQDEALKQIEKAVSAAKGPDGKPYEVTALSKHEEALALLDTGEHFDVVITDMVMGPDATEGLEVLRKLTAKSPITIVLTAYPLFPTCVAAMRAGAWDYLEKDPADGSDAYENLLNSLREACDTRLAAKSRMDPDSRWAQEHLGELMLRYPGKLVAVLDGRVVGEDVSYGDLVNRVKEMFPVARPTIVSVPNPSPETVE